LGLPISIDHLDVEDAHTLVVRASVDLPGWEDTTFHVRYMPDMGYVDLSGVLVDAPNRSQGLAARLGLYVLRTAQSLGYVGIFIEAGPTMGRAVWARYEFRFARQRCRDDMRRWFVEALPLLGIDDVDLAKCNEPADFYMVGAGQSLGMSLGEIAEKLGYDDFDRSEIVAANAEASDIHAGHALLLFGPNWHGVMPAAGPWARRFEQRCVARLKALGLKVPASPADS
jgi:GNAT superfamily N-acetyltransferase